MFTPEKTPRERRQALRDSLSSPTITKLPGAFSPLVARLLEDIGGFEGVYVSGAVVANDLGLPDIGLTTLTEVANRSRQIARVTNLPVLVDADTGFGEPMSAARTDAADIEVIDSAIERAEAYADAGADLIFTEALYTEADFEKFRTAMGQTEAMLREIAQTGTQEPWLDRMQHRSRLYELVRYDEYNQFDQSVFTYSVDTYRQTFEN